MKNATEAVRSITGVADFINASVSIEQCLLEMKSRKMESLFAIPAGALIRFYNTKNAQFLSVTRDVNGTLLKYCLSSNN